LARFTTNGTLDATFGKGGFVTTDFGKSHDPLGALAIQPDGKVIAVGSGRIQNVDYMTLVRYLTTPVSPPAIRARVALSSGQVRISWPALEGEMELEAADDPAGPWTAVLAVSEVSGTEKAFSVNASGASRFFRLRRR
jgi:hypothetical protein